MGNWVADEVLYQARLHPEAPAKLLTEGEVERLHSALHSVPKTAVDAGADSSRFPKDWLFHHRWSKKKAGGSVGGRAIEIITVGGRTTAYVPEVQKLSEQAAAGEFPASVQNLKVEGVGPCLRHCSLAWPPHICHMTASSCMVPFVAALLVKCSH